MWVIFISPWPILSFIIHVISIIYWKRGKQIADNDYVDRLGEMGMCYMK